MVASYLTDTEVWRAAGFHVGSGVPWEAVWTVPLENLEQFAGGLAEAAQHRSKQ